MKKLFLLCSISCLSSVYLLAQDARFDVCPLKVGEKVPTEIAVSNMDGENQLLENIIDSLPTVLVFYRGGWCPYCTKHLSALQEVKDDLIKEGFQLLAITPDKFNNLEKSYAKSSADFTILSDVDAQAIKAFGLAWKVDDEKFAKYKSSYNLDLEEWSGQKHHLLPVPAVFIIKNKVVQFQYVNPDHSTRLKPETLMALIKGI